MRGWTYQRHHWQSERRIFPAYAGVNLTMHCRKHHSEDIPRVCGGEPTFRLQRLDTRRYSPRMRGWTYCDAICPHIDWIFPAYAGVNLIIWTTNKLNLNIPRVCGGEPRCARSISVCISYSPRMRGWTWDMPVVYGAEAIFPAYAGVNLQSARSTTATWYIPRVCGGEPGKYALLLFSPVYSPRMRGWTFAHQ